MHECIKLLLGSLDDPNAVPDDESIEAAAKLFLTIGKQLESPAASKAKLDAHYPEPTISNNALATTLHFLGTASGSLFFQEIKQACCTHTLYATRPLGVPSQWLERTAS